MKRCVWQHKNNIIPGFTSKYKVYQLVYYEAHQDIMNAARRERRLKEWCREWKINLIQKFQSLTIKNFNIELDCVDLNSNSNNPIADRNQIKAPPYRHNHLYRNEWFGKTT